MIVITPHEMLLPVETGKDRCGMLALAPHEVAQVPHGVGRADALVPAPDDLLLHLLDRDEGVAVKVQNGLMPEMGIARVENGHCSLSRRCADPRLTRGRTGSWLCGTPRAGRMRPENVQRGRFTRRAAPLFERDEWMSGARRA